MAAEDALTFLTVPSDVVDFGFFAGVFGGSVFCLSGTDEGIFAFSRPEPVRLDASDALLMILLTDGAPFFKAFNFGTAGFVTTCVGGIETSGIAFGALTDKVGAGSDT